MLIIVGVAGVHFATASKPQAAQITPTPAIKPANFKQPVSLSELLALKPENLGAIDIGLLNLLCAEGLPGAENLDIPECMATLDQWAESLRFQIDLNFHHYQENPAYYYHSTNFYNMVMMASILYTQMRIRYNPNLIEASANPKPDDHFFADSRNILIHGLLGPNRMGTCNSMPVLYVALGRRLGYPLKLVQGNGHFFMRWDGPTERFNMDGTTKGIEKHDDEWYRNYPSRLTDEEIKANGLLQSMTPAQELATFLSTRATCLYEAGRLREVIASHAAAIRLEPNWQHNHRQLRVAERDYAGASAASLRKSTPHFETEQEAREYEDWKTQTLKELERAELGLPQETPLTPQK